MQQFKNRKEQIEKDFAARLFRDLKNIGCPLTAKGRRLVKEELKSSAMVGAFEERHRVLKFESMNSRLRELITEPSVLSVLGYE